MKSTSVTIEVVRQVTARTPHGGNDEREVKLEPDHQHGDHDDDDDHYDDYDHDQQLCLYNTFD